MSALIILWHALNTPLGIALAGSALYWIAQKLGLVGDAKDKQVLALAAMVADQVPTGTPWVDYVKALIDAMEARAMGTPSGPQMNAIKTAWEAMGGEKPTPRIVSKAYQNGTKVPPAKASK